MSQRRCERRSRGFTLVELLVVIGVIAVLIGILLPALQSARRAAATVKCATALREIGNSFQMYAQENKGYAPPTKLIGGAYNVNGSDYPSATPAYWFDFLAKYVTKTKTGYAGTTALTASDAKNKSIFWACPAWDGYNSSTSGSGVALVQTGYGMNAFPEYQPNWPAPNAQLGEPTITSTSPEKDQVNTPAAGTNVWNDFTNRWYKLNKWNHASERALVSDAQYWLLEAKRGVNPIQLPNLGQQLLANGPGPGGSIWSGSADGASQTTFDWYRHGKYPRVKSADQYDGKGGKISYNILYADGHVGNATDKETSYRSARMRYPG